MHRTFTRRAFTALAGAAAMCAAEAPADAATRGLIAAPQPAPGHAVRAMVDVVIISTERARLYVVVRGAAPGSRLGVYASALSCGALRRGPRRPLRRGAVFTADAAGTVAIVYNISVAWLRSPTRSIAVGPATDAAAPHACGRAQALRRTGRRSRVDVITAPLVRSCSGAAESADYRGNVHVHLAGGRARVRALVTGLPPGSYGVGIGFFGCPQSGKVTLLAGPGDVAVDGALSIGRAFRLRPALADALVLGGVDIVVGDRLASEGMTHSGRFHWSVR